MKLWIAILLGLVQGLCEFLPVSSSGHLVLLQNIFGIDEGMLFFDTMLHMGTLIAVVVVFYKQLWAMIKKPFQKKVAMLLISTAVTAVLAFAFKDAIIQSYEGALLGFGFLATAVILLLSELLARGNKTIEQMKPWQAAGIGLMQGVAILPGISRSGSTIAGSRFFGLKKEEAAEFSFILSIPAILGSLVMQLPDVIESGTAGIPWIAVAVGTLVAAVSGYFAIRFMLELIKRKSLIGFAIYVAALGMLVLIDQFAVNAFFVRPF
ncbi:MAG: undecaprenyl-diphosphate phosphatase [Clostridia bacterium]